VEGLHDGKMAAEPAQGRREEPAAKRCASGSLTAPSKEPGHQNILPDTMPDWRPGRSIDPHREGSRLWIGRRRPLQFVTDFQKNKQLFEFQLLDPKQFFFYPSLPAESEHPS
jgi:hypothetical protein